jgi:hypothetical protein
MASDSDILWGMYQEHCTQGRHHEDQRASVTNLIIALASAMVGLLAFKDLSRNAWPLPCTLILLGLFGALFSLKHYERFRYHMKCAAQYRDALESLVPTTNLKALRQAGRRAHRGKYKIIEDIHLFVFWVAFNLLIASLGGILLYVVLHS